MSCKIVILFISSMMMCIALPQKKMMGDECKRPEMFRSLKHLEEYVSCVKLLASDHRYGKRAHASHLEGIFRNLRPNLYADYAMAPSDDVQDIYDLIRFDDN